jgi:hypothetical protein
MVLHNNKTARYTVSALLELDKMTTVEKIRTMEQLWDDLSKNAENVLSPDWHDEILQQREEAVAEGKASFNDWETEKKRIRESLS